MSKRDAPVKKFAGQRGELARSRRAFFPSRFPRSGKPANYWGHLMKVFLQIRWMRLLAGLGLAAGLALGARAHEVGLSTAVAQVRTQAVTVELTFALKDAEELAELDANRDGQVTATEFATREDEYNEIIAATCGLRLGDAFIPPASVRSLLDTSNNVVSLLEFPVGMFERLDLHFEVIRELPAGHRTLFSLVNAAGQTITERLLNQNSPVTTIRGDMEASAPAGILPSFAGFFWLGVEHIGIGYDHLMFLFGLLLVTHRFRDAFVVISCFTLAHSITLAVATFDLLNLPGEYTEPLIAATIIYVGAENILRRGHPRGRWLLTFLFGLIHGFGFASVLRDLGVGARGGGVTMPLLAFNLGVELGQIAIAAMALPIIWRLHRNPAFVRYLVPGGSAVVVVLGVFWLIQRVWF